MADEMEWQLLDRLLAGDCSPEEADRVRAWLAADPRRQEVFDLLRAGHSTNEGPQIDAAWRRVAARTVEEHSVSPSDTVPRRTPSRGIMPMPTRHRLPRIWRIAAAIILAIGAIGVWRLRSGPSPIPGNVVATAPWRDISVPRGTRASIDLADGSRITLNGGSHLRYPADIGHGARELYLEGEGYFVVAHDSTHPFQVHIGGAVVRDVGTRFVAQAYTGDREATVVVEEGVVAFGRAGAEDSTHTVLHSGMLGRFTAAGALSFHVVDTNRYTAWMDGRLILDDIAVADAVPLLERWYDVDIRVSDSLVNRRRVSAEFRAEPLPEVLSALAVALNVHIARDGRRVTISAKEQP